MAITNFAGFETSGTIEARIIAGTLSVQNTVARTGTYALRVNVATTGTGYFGLGPIGASSNIDGNNTTTCHTQFYFRYATKATGVPEPIIAGISGNTNVGTVRLGSDGVLRLVNSSNTVVATGSAVLLANTWYKITMQWNGFGGGTQILSVDGVQQWSVATTLGGCDYFAYGRHTSIASQSLDYFYDDIVIADNGGLPAGDHRVINYRPTSDGSTAAWNTGTNASNYLEVDELAPDGDTTYIRATTNTQVHYVKFTPDIDSGGSVAAVKANVSGKGDGVTGGVSSIRFKSNASVVTQVFAQTNVAYRDGSFIRTTDPDGNSTWTVADLGTVELGAISNVTSNAARISSIQMSVLFTGTYGTIPPEKLSGFMHFFK